VAQPDRLGGKKMSQRELYACLVAREFPAQAMLRLRPQLREKAVAVMQGDPPLQSVCALNAKARRLGVAAGMTRVEIDTFDAVTTLERSSAEEAAARNMLLECAGTFSPRIEDLSAQNDRSAFVCVIDIAGTEKLFGPPQALVQSLLRRVRALGVAVSIAVSSNFHAAICLARARPSHTTVIPHGSESEALAPLSISVLNLSVEYAEIFALWGIRTLGALAELPEKDLVSRLGQEGKRLRQLAHGQHSHLFVPMEQEFRLEEWMELDTPVELLESLLFVIGMMLEQLILRATARVLALASVTVMLSLEGGASHARMVRPALPSNDRQLWLKLLHLDLEAHPPPAAILTLSLTAEPGSTSKVQLGLFSPQLPEAMRLDVTLARIRAIVGEDCVGRAMLTDTHRRDGFRMEPFTISSASTSASTVGRPNESSKSLAAMRQLRPAEIVGVLLRGAKPVAFTFRDRRYDVEHVYGPWLSAGDWWNLSLWGFEQWDLIARAGDGSLLCCCVVRDLAQQAWQMVTLYD
jgi:protein ImuB